MATRRKITQAERRHQDQLRRNGLRVAAVYETRLAKSRRAELRRVLDLARDYKPEAIEDVIIENLDESGYLPGWWVGLWTQAGMPMAKETARALREAKAAEEDDIWQMTLRSYATRRAGNEIVSVTGTWRDSLVKITREVMEADLGLGVEKITKRIYEQYRDRLEKWQIRRIAQTEAMIGMADAAALSATTLDVRFTKEWCISGLGNTRESHEAMDGVVVDMDEPFKLPGGLMMYPHDTSMDADAGEIINCACACIRRPKRGATTQERRPEPGQREVLPEPTPEQQAREERIAAIMKEMPEDMPDEVKRAIAENDLALEDALGVKKGAPMDLSKADEQHANPNYVSPYIKDPEGTLINPDGERVRINPDYHKFDKQYEVNCVTCANSFLLRERGFDVTAKGRVVGSGSINDKAAEGFNAWSMWMKADGKRAIPTDMRSWLGQKGYKTMTKKHYAEFFEEACKEKGDYLTVIGWGKVNGHATILRREASGKLVYIEPQVYDKAKGARLDVAELYKRGTSKPRLVDGVMRIDDKIFDVHWAGLFNAK